MEAQLSQLVPAGLCYSTVNQPAKISDYCMICDATWGRTGEDKAGHPQNRKLGIGRLLACRVTRVRTLSSVHSCIHLSVTELDMQNG